MLCVNCNAKLRTVRTEQYADNTCKRYKKCDSCGTAYYTFEKIIEVKEKKGEVKK